MSALLTRVQACGTSFYWGIRLLPERRREAMAALYLFCRAVDDIVDDPGPADEDTRRAALDVWRAALEHGTPAPDAAVGAALAAARRDFALPLEPFMAVIDGMAMDLPPGICAPPREALTLYCERVAGAVGLVSVRLFGARDPAADAFALATGEALQFTNILRDVAADAALGRLYLPRDLLDAHGVPPEPDAALAHPGLPAVCAAFAAEAQQRHALALDALRPLPATDRAALRPAVVMLMLYRDLLDRLEQRGWDALNTPPPKAGALRRLLLVLRYRAFDP